MRHRMFAGVHAGAHRYLCHARGYPGHGHGRHSGDSMEHEMLARRRKFGAQELQLLFLALLAEKPCHGYELIKDIEQRSRGYYVPSPGVVYPALTFLEETGLVEVEADGNRKLYRVSTLGVAHLESAREEVKLTLARLSFVGKKMETMRRAMQGEGGEPDPDGWLPEYIAAHRGLKRALVLKADADEAEQRRIAAILQRAIAEIEGTGNE